MISRPGRSSSFTSALRLAVLSLSLATLCASTLDEVVDRGYLRVGTTGDFKPFTYLNPETGAYEGIDIDAAKSIAAALGVEVRFVATTWSTVVEGIAEERYDIAMGGITRTLARQMRVGISAPYFEVGKCPLVRDEDAGRLTTVEALNHPGVHVGVNPGGTNEAFVRTYLSKATITLVPDNLAIPGKVLSGEVDVMMTDNVEAMLFASRMPGLSAVNPQSPFTKEDFGYLLPRGDAVWLSWVNLWMHQAEQKGHYAEWRKRWIDAGG